MTAYDQLHDATHEIVETVTEQAEELGYQLGLSEDTNYGIAGAAAGAALFLTGCEIGDAEYARVADDFNGDDKYEVLLMDEGGDVRRQLDDAPQYSMDEDSFPDVVIADPNSATPALYLQTGVSEELELAVEDVKEVRALDYDGDGDNDLAVQRNNLEWEGYENSGGTGSFRDRPEDLTADTVREMRTEELFDRVADRSF